MQTIIFNEQESEPIQSISSVNHPVGTLVFGLLLGLLLMLFEQRNQPQALEAESERAGGWGRTLGTVFVIGLALFILVNLILGP